MLSEADITGRIFGRLTVIGEAGENRHGQRLWLCHCACGSKKTFLKSSIVRGASRSCGCAKRTSNGEANYPSGKRSSEYSIWAGIKARCSNAKSPKWPDYGGRGIKVCDSWRRSYVTFLADVGRRPSPAHSLDRINNNGDYEPGNVRWATGKIQAANRRPVQKRNWREAAKHAYAVVKDFEDVVASYTGAKYVVAVESCTSALLLACAYLKVKEVELPRFTYCGVPMSVLHSGGRVTFRDEEWNGMYQLAPHPIYDSARLFTSGMYKAGTFMCVSFHWAKHLPIGRGGAILCDDRKAAEWFKRARFDGRHEKKSPKNDGGLILGWHMYFTPPQAAQGLMLMASIAEHNQPLPWGPGTTSDYGDLSKLEIFQ